MPVALATLAYQFAAAVGDTGQYEIAVVKDDENPGFVQVTVW